MKSGVVCAAGVELLADYLEGLLPPDVRADLEAHVGGCPRCAAFLETYRATPDILRRATAVDLPPDLAGALREFLRRQS